MARELRRQPCGHAVPGSGHQGPSHLCVTGALVAHLRGGQSRQEPQPTPAFNAKEDGEWGARGPGHPLLEPERYRDFQEAYAQWDKDNMEIGRLSQTPDEQLPGGRGQPGQQEQSAKAPTGRQDGWNLRGTPKS